MEALKIAVTCIVAAVLYGIVHDQFTARICIEYFTIFHPPVFHTQSPTLLGIGWGILATWWVGVFFAWYCSEPRLAFNRIVVVRYRMYLESHAQ